MILGQNNGNVPRILGIIADVCAESALQDDEQVYMRLLSIARHIQVKLIMIFLNLDTECKIYLMWPRVGF